MQQTDAAGYHNRHDHKQQAHDAIGDARKTHAQEPDHKRRIARIHEPFPPEGSGKDAKQPDRGEKYDYENVNRHISSKGNGTGAVGIFGYRHLDGIGGQQLLDQLRPLDEAVGTAVKIILKAHVIDFLQPLYAVEVEVEDISATGRLIGVDDGKGWRGHRVFHTEGFAQGLDECRLARPHFAIECIYPVLRFHLRDELLCRLVQRIYVFN